MAKNITNTKALAGGHEGKGSMEGGGERADEGAGGLISADASMCAMICGTGTLSLSLYTYTLRV